MSRKIVDVQTGLETSDGSYVSPGFDLSLEQKRSVASLERADFAIAAATASHISFSEAEEWAAGNSLPNTVLTAIATLPVDQQGPARIVARSKQRIERSGDLIPVIAAAFGIDEAGVDALFGI